MKFRRTLIVALWATWLALPELCAAQQEGGPGEDGATASTEQQAPPPQNSNSEPEQPLGKIDTKAGETAETAAPSEKTESKDTADETSEKQPESLTVASWGGAYTESQKRAYASPFESETGIDVKMVTHGGSFTTLLNGESTDRPDWDVVDLDLAALDEACRSGKLEKVEASELAATKDGTPANEDFLPGTLHDCGIPSVAWSSTIVYDKRAFKKAAPKIAKDLFDVKQYPGKRSLPDDPKYVFELALMADGVEPADVYKTLETYDGIARALKMLDQIKEHVVWWDRAYIPLKQLSKQEVAMALAFNGRIFSSIVSENKPFGIIWDGQIFDLDFWAIPKGAPNKKSSLSFISFATRPDRLAKQADWFPYGPVRKSALNLVGKHPEVHVDMAEFLPTADANFKRALRLDTLWWKEHAEEMRKKFSNWKEGVVDDPRATEDLP